MRRKLTVLAVCLSLMLSVFSMTSAVLADPIGAPVNSRCVLNCVGTSACLVLIMTCFAQAVDIQFAANIEYIW